jgi:hypothetical protein
LKEILEKEKCIKQPAQIAGKSVKFLFNQKKADLYIAGIATKNTENQDLADLNPGFNFFFIFYYIFFFDNIYKAVKILFSWGL